MTRLLRRRSLNSLPKVKEISVPVPPRPPYASLKRGLERTRSEGSRQPRDGFIRESFSLPREAARAKAREWFDRDGVSG